MVAQKSAIIRPPRASRIPVPARRKSPVAQLREPPEHDLSSTTLRRKHVRINSQPVVCPAVRPQHKDPRPQVEQRYEERRRSQRPLRKDSGHGVTMTAITPPKKQEADLRPLRAAARQPSEVVRPRRTGTSQSTLADQSLWTAVLAPRSTDRAH